MDPTLMEGSSSRAETDNSKNPNEQPPLQKPSPAAIHQDKSQRATASGIGGDGPLSHLRRRSADKLENGQPNSSTPQSPTSDALSDSLVGKRIVADGSHKKTQSWATAGPESTDQERVDSIDLDVERGMKLEDLRAVRAKNTRRNSALGHVRRTSDATRNSQLMEVEDDDWNEAHPCFTHPNPHVPLNSPEAETTKVIRIPREYMVNGDISPAYSIVYPQILQDYLSEEQFRMIIDRINEELRVAFDPWNKWNLLDVIVGLLTLWLAEDIYDTFVKRKLKALEEFIDEQNKTLDTGARIISLRRTGYINLDIEIPDPLAPIPEDEEFEGSQATAREIHDKEMKSPNGPLSDPGTVPALQITGDTSPYLTQQR